MTGLFEKSMTELGQMLMRGEVSSVELTRACLQRIADTDGKVRAFLHVDGEGAMAQARASDERRSSRGPASPLDGVPIALKDVFVTQGVPTTCGSKILEGWVPPFDATVTARLKAAGLPLLGKLNMDEFAMGSSTENSGFHPTHNPYDLTRTPGGSSGGSAAAVAARQVPGSFGTDTGGSIRQPAAFTNTVGLKPTYGRVSRFGVVAYASSLDQPGPMARSVDDVATLLQVVAGADPNDATCSTAAVPDFNTQIEAGVKGLKLGLPREYFAAGLDPEVEAAVRAAAKEYERLGATLVDVSLPHTKYALAAYYVLAPAEASSNLGRYDGLRFGPREEAASLRETYVKTRSARFGKEVQRRILLGTFALSSGYYDAYYLKAQKVRTLVRRDFDAAFAQCDVLLSPASPVPPFKLGEKTRDPLSMYLLDALTLPVNLAGLPGLSLACGFTQSGLPIGLQLMGQPFDEPRLLTAGRAYEREHGFAAKGPVL